jgi:hypothetical protein
MIYILAKNNLGENVMANLKSKYINLSIIQFAKMDKIAMHNDTGTSITKLCATY